MGSRDGDGYGKRRPAFCDFTMSHPSPPTVMPSPSTVARPYKCNQCDRSFARPSGRTRHINTTHASDAKPAGRTSLLVIERHPLLSGMDLLPHGYLTMVDFS
jgi:hypothetical protein